MVEKYTLKNGIPVFIVESSASPVVSIQAWVSRGSIHEPDKLAGISHFLEHALFKGTSHRGVGEVAREIEAHGGDINAFTSFEETVYYTTLASRFFEDGLDIITDIVQNPTFDREEMLKEREVILEEIKRAQDSPHRILSMNLWKQAFSKTPYGRPVLGFESTVSQIDGARLEEYHRQQYHAGTVALIVVGDIEAKAALGKISKKLGSLKIKRGNPPRRFRVPLPSGTPRPSQWITQGRDINQCLSYTAWITPGITDAQIPALDLLASSLGSGESSRLYQRVVKEKKLATDINLGLSATGDCGMLSLYLETSPENLFPALEQAQALFKETLAQGIRESEIERVKSSLESEVVAGKETVDGYARRLGSYYIHFKDPDYEKKYLELVLGTDLDETTEALASLHQSKPITSIVHPNGFTVDVKRLGKLWNKSAKKKVQTTGHGLVTPELTHLEGFRLVSKKITSLPIIALRFIFLGGSREEKTTELGVGTLLQRVWTSGTPSQNSFQIARTLESLGASINAYCGKNTLGISTEFLTKHWPIVRPLLTDILTQPVFREEEFQIEKDILLRDLATERDTPGQVCQLNFYSALYGSHPYGRSSLGTQVTVSNLTQESLIQFYKRFVHRKSLVVSLVGNIDKDIWTEELTQICRTLPSDGGSISKALPMDSISELNIITAKKEPLHQSHVLVGFLGATFASPHRFALKALSSYLSGQGGKLFLELRDKQSLAYQVAPIQSDGPEPGMFGFYIGCSPEKLGAALSGIRKEVELLREELISPKELERAKQFWIGRFELDMQRYGSQAMLFGLDEAYGLGFQHSLTLAEKVKAITAQDIRRAAREFLNPGCATLSIVHPEALDDDTVASLWLGKSTHRVSEGGREKASVTV